MAWQDILSDLAPTPSGEWSTNDAGDPARTQGYHQELKGMWDKLNWRDWREPLGALAGHTPLGPAVSMMQGDTSWGDLLRTLAPSGIPQGFGEGSLSEDLPVMQDWANSLGMMGGAWKKPSGIGNLDWQRGVAKLKSVLQEMGGESAMMRGASEMPTVGNGVMLNSRAGGWKDLARDNAANAGRPIQKDLPTMWEAIAERAGNRSAGRSTGGTPEPGMMDAMGDAAYWKRVGGQPKMAEPPSGIEHGFEFGQAKPTPAASMQEPIRLRDMELVNPDMGLAMSDAPTTSIWKQPIGELIYELLNAGLNRAGVSSIPNPLKKLSDLQKLFGAGLAGGATAGAAYAETPDLSLYRLLGLPRMDLSKQYEQAREPDYVTQINRLANSEYGPLGRGRPDNQRQEMANKREEERLRQEALQVIANFRPR